MIAELTGAHDPGPELVVAAQADQPAGVEAVETVGGCLEGEEVGCMLHRCRAGVVHDDVVICLSLESITDGAQRG